jgi:hypothetical protein
LVIPEILYQFEGIVGVIKLLQPRYVLPSPVHPKPMLRISLDIVFENLI